MEQYFLLFDWKIQSTPQIVNCKFYETWPVAWVYLDPPFGLTTVSEFRIEGNFRHPRHLCHSMYRPRFCYLRINIVIQVFGSIFILVSRCFLILSFLQIHIVVIRITVEIKKILVTFPSMGFKKLRKQRMLMMNITNYCKILISIAGLQMIK